MKKYNIFENIEIDEKENYALFNLIKIESKEKVEKRILEAQKRYSEIDWYGYDLSIEETIRKIEDALENCVYDINDRENILITEGISWIVGNDEIEGITF